MAFERYISFGKLYYRRQPAFLYEIVFIFLTKHGGKNMEDRFEEMGFEYLNESIAEEIADEEDLNIGDEERLHYNEFY